MLLTLRLLTRAPVVAPEAVKTKAKLVMVEMKSVVTGHKYSAFREKLADKLEVINWDPLVRAEVVFKESRKIRSHPHSSSKK